MFWKRLAFMKMRNRLKSETSKEHKDSFFKSFRPLLIFAQVCGLLPVRGIFGKSANAVPSQRLKVTKIKSYVFGFRISSRTNQIHLEKSNDPLCACGVPYDLLL